VQDGSKRRARLILIIGVVLALFAGAGTFFYASSAQTQTPTVIPTAPVLVAAREIPAKTTLTAADIKVADFNADVKPAAALSNPADAIGKITIQSIAVGEPIMPTKFSDPKNPAFVVIPASFIGPDGAPQAGSPAFRAMSITIADPNAVGGAVQPGDIVDLLFTMNLDPIKYFDKPKPIQTADFSAKIILERLTILARLGAVYTIRVDAVTAERIAYIQSAGGQMMFLLRAPKDERASGSTGTTFENVYTAFNLKVPAKIPAP